MSPGVPAVPASRRWRTGPRDTHRIEVWPAPFASSAVMKFVQRVQPDELTDFQLEQLILASARRRVAGG